MKNPSIDAANILMKSLRSTFSFGMNKETSQKSPPAISDLSVKIPSGGMSPPLVRSLQTIMLNPNIAYAMNAAICPNAKSLFLINRMRYLFTFQCNNVLHMVSVWEHVHWAYSCDDVVLAEDLEIASL